MGPILTRFLWVGLTAFGAARWVNLEAAFVRTGLLRREDFGRDLAIANTLPGPSFVNLTALCGMRLGGVRVATLAVVLVLLPGLVAIVLALAFLSPEQQWVARLFHGILVGAVGVLGSAFARQARDLRGTTAPVLAAATVVLVALGASMALVVVGVACAGVLRYRWSRQTLP